MMPRTYLFTIFFLFSLTTALSAQRWYVSATATGSGTGTTWQDAFTDVQDALLVVQAGEEIWIANGVYYPGQNDSSTFEIPGGVSIYGGFVGFESLLSDRNLQNAATVFSGDIGVAGDSSDNVWHIVKIFNTTLPILIDGIHFTGGSAWTGITHTGGYRGGAIWMQSANLKLSHCQFTQNYGRLGGAIYQSGGSLEIRACLFDGNRAETDFGGAVASAGNASLEIWDSRFQNNYARAGGAIAYNASGTFSLYRTLLHSNESVESGSALHVSGSSDSIRISNCLMVANQSGYGSVIYQNLSSGSGTALEMIHCTIAHNYSFGTQTTESALHVIAGNTKLKNSIHWQNNTPSEINNPALVNADHCNIHFGFGNGNSVTNIQPQFIKPIGLLSYPIDADTIDYRLQYISPLRNTGNSNLISPEDSMDINGVHRILLYSPAPGAFALNPCIQSSSLSYVGLNDRCSGDILTLTAPVANQYLWNKGDTTRHIQIQSSGRYSVLLVYSALSCYSTAEDTFTFHNPMVSIIGPTVICNPPISTPVTLKINGTWSSILWSTQANIDSIQTYTPGTYSVTVTDSFGCQSSSSKMLPSESGLQANISIIDTSGLYPNDNLACSQSFIKIELSGAHAYKVNQSSITTQTTFNQYIGTPRTFYVTGYSPLGCPGTLDSVFVDMYPYRPPIGVLTEHSEYNSNDNRICSGDSLTISIEPGFDYSWFDGSQDTFRKFIVPNNNNQPITYWLYARDTNACYYKMDFTIVTIQPITPVLPIRFENGQLETDNSSKFQWYLNAAKLPGYTTRTMVPIGTGSYKVQAREPKGCMVFSEAYYYLFLSDDGLSENDKVLKPYPNPATRKLYIPGITAGEIISIWDIHGRLFTRTVGDNLALNIEDLVPGKYTLQFNEAYYTFVKLNE